LAFFQIRKTVKHGVIKSLSAEISVSENKVLITAGGLFGTGILLFSLGALLQSQVSDLPSEADF
jgi:hypothetical protein